MFDIFFSNLLYALGEAYLALYWFAPGVSAAALILGLDAFKRDSKTGAIIWSVIAIPGLAAIGLHWGFPPLLSWYKERPFSFPAWHIALFVLEAGVGGFTAIYWLRHGASKRDVFVQKLTKKSVLERDCKTDIRHLDKILPPEIKRYEPEQYIDLKKGVFAGLNKDLKPTYFDPEMFDECHLMLCGRTRSGKGVAGQIQGTQSIRRGELFVVLDPKADKFMPHVFKAECDAVKQPYVYLDLRQSAPPQINPFEGADVEKLENMLLAAFSLSERGDSADFYRVGDRRAALECARLIVEMRNKNGVTPTPAEIMQTEAAGRWQEDATNFWGYMMEMAELASVNARDGLSLESMVATGGCLYIQGDMGNARVVRMQRLFLLRLMQLAAQRVSFNDEKLRTIRVFADEFTVHISKPFMVSLAASAGWGLCVILAFQTLGDLADCPSDLDKEAVKAKVWENCALKLLYAVRDGETAEWLAQSTGTILVDEESRRVDKNLAMAETISGERTIRQSETYLIDTNMLLGLPKGCGVLFGASRLPEYCYTSPVRATRTPAAITPTHVDQTAPVLGGSVAAGLVDVEGLPLRPKKLTKDNQPDGEAIAPELAEEGPLDPADIPDLNSSPGADEAAALVSLD